MRLHEFHSSACVGLRALQRFIFCLVLVIGWDGQALLPAAKAQAALPEISQLKLDRTDDGIFLSAQLKFEISNLVEEALLKGIPIFFVMEAEINRDRWYWYDKTISSSKKNIRLAYQPLTRRWRLNSSPGSAANGGSGLGVTLNQNFETLADALASLKRVSGWRVAELGEMDMDARYWIDFRFRLDVSQLARPLQIGTLGQSDWTINLSRNQRVVFEASK
ncbi:MAG: DUF4390 domain-containing protein [Burkholderiaceae bacterium]